MTKVSQQASRHVRVWDGSLRLFHWALVVAFGTLWGSAYGGRLDVHFLAGEAVLALLAFRFVWGWVGSGTARFKDFVRGVSAVWVYLRTGRSESVGHNPLGGWMVVVMLSVLLGQVVSGLLATGDLLEPAPWAHLLSASASVRAFEVHERLSKLLMGLVVLHVLAVIAHRWMFGHDLIGPMLTGRKRLPAHSPDVPQVPLVWTAAAWLLSAGVTIVAFVLCRT